MGRGHNASTEFAFISEGTRFTHKINNKNSDHPGFEHGPLSSPTANEPDDT